MPDIATAKDEEERLRALASLEILDTAPSLEFDIFPRLASSLLSTPMAAVSFVGENRQWNKSSVGLDLAEVDREWSFCAHAILDPSQVLHVPDATKDKRFADNPLVTGEFGLRFYAGAPVLGPGGEALGALCVIDRRPRVASEEELGHLQMLAVGVGSALRLHASARELARLALTDPLTGLSNRAGFDQRLNQAIARQATIPGGMIGLLFIDLDAFKVINDLFGHTGGDLALKEVSSRLRRLVRSADGLSRFGGDEFCVLLDGALDGDALEMVASRIHAALADPFLIDGRAVRLKASIGAALCRPGLSDPKTVLRDADHALYEAKRAGRGMTRLARSALWTPGLSAGTSAGLNAGRTRMEELLREALIPPGREPFNLALQPQFEAQTEELTGFEALVRWPGPDGHVRQPAEFIPVAESTGLVVHLDRWVLDQACALAAPWPAALDISSNLSAANFYSGDLVDDVRRILEERGLAPSRLKLEVTETVLLSDPERVRGVIAGLRDLGLTVVLDDFGVGHASLSYLQRYAFSGLKIDRSFVHDVEGDPRSQAFIRAIVEMAHALDVRTVAEGVETVGQLRALQSKGVETVQGFLLGRPMSPDSAARLIERRTGWISGLGDGMPARAASAL